jgi:hypothetical protein
MRNTGQHIRKLSKANGTTTESRGFYPSVSEWFKFNLKKLMKTLKFFGDSLRVLRRLAGALVIAFATSAFLPAVNTVSAENLQLNPEFNQPGNILIADQFNNRVIEIDQYGHIIWSYGLGPNDFSSNSVIGVNDAERVGTYTLMAGTGTPAGLIPQSTGGALDNRVLLVDSSGKIVWQYGQFGQSGDGPDLLNTPMQCTFLSNTNILIADQGNNRIIEVNFGKQIVWQYPDTNTDDADQISSPSAAELLANGNILISDQGNSRAIEVTRAGKVVNTFSAGGTVSILAFASRLENGDTLLTDSGNARIVEVDTNDLVVWQYFTDTDPLSVAAPLPTRAVRLSDGDTLISDQFNNRVIRIDQAGDLLASYGLPLDGGGTFGNNVGDGLDLAREGLYAPADAKIVGDYTGLTPPVAGNADNVGDNTSLTPPVVAAAHIVGGYAGLTPPVAAVADNVGDYTGLTPPVAADADVVGDDTGQTPPVAADADDKQ